MIQNPNPVKPVPANLSQTSSRSHQYPNNFYNNSATGAIPQLNREAAGSNHQTYTGYPVQPSYPSNNNPVQSFQPNNNGIRQPMPANQYGENASYNTYAGTAPRAPVPGSNVFQANQNWRCVAPNAPYRVNAPQGETNPYSQPFYPGFYNVPTQTNNTMNQQQQYIVYQQQQQQPIAASQYQSSASISQMTQAYRQAMPSSSTQSSASSHVPAEKSRVKKAIMIVDPDSGKVVDPSAKDIDNKQNSTAETIPIKNDQRAIFAQEVTKRIKENSESETTVPPAKAVSITSEIIPSDEISGQKKSNEVLNDELVHTNQKTIEAVQISKDETNEEIIPTKTIGVLSEPQADDNTSNNGVSTKVEPEIEKESLVKEKIDLIAETKGIAVPVVQNDPSPVIDVNMNADLPNSNVADKPIETKVEETNLPEAKKDLGFKYPQDQWSPINTDGKKQYDRDFLMWCQNHNLSKKKPDDLPSLDIILNEMKDVRDKKDFTPNYAIMSIPSKGSRNGRINDRRSQNTPKKIEIIIDSKPVELSKTANPYKLKPANQLDQTESALRTVRGLLNKLTPQNFQALVEQFNAVKIDTEDSMKGMIDLIFEKAIDEPAFSVAYANLCKSLSKSLANIRLQTTEGKEFTFRSGLLNRCQEQFEKSRTENAHIAELVIKKDAATNEDDKKILILEIEQFEYISKRRYLGNIRFIGELFKLKMLTENIMHSCLFELLKSHDEEKLECLCKLMKTIGKECDYDKAKNRMDQYFQQMHKIIEQKKVSSRVRFMLQDTIELRGSNWVPRRDENVPKTLTEVRKELERELQEKDKLAQMPIQKPGRKSMSGNMNAGRNAHQNDEGWQTNMKPQRNDMDRSRMLNLNSYNPGVPQLGPSKKWTSGANGGRNHMNVEESSEPTNRFSILQHNDEAKSLISKSRSVQGPSSSKKNRNENQTKYISRASADDRRDAINATRNIVSGNKQPSRSLSRDKKIVKISEDEIERRVKTIIDEYLQIKVITDVEQYIEEMVERHANESMILTKIIDNVIERSSEIRKNIGLMFHTLIINRKTTINTKSLISSLSSHLEFAEDIEIDIPKIWLYIAELLANPISKDTFSLKDLFISTTPMLKSKSSKVGILFREVIYQVSAIVGQQKMTELWKKSALKWEQVVFTNVEEFLASQKLTFTINTDVNSKLSVESLANDIMNVWSLKNAEKIHSWIEKTIAEEDTRTELFIHYLIYGLFEHCKTGSDTASCFDSKIFKPEYLAVTKRYIDNIETSESAVLKAAQKFATDLNHPPKLFNDIVSFIYDELEISDEAFSSWYEKDNKEAGYGICRAGSEQFYKFFKKEITNPDNS